MKSDAYIQSELTTTPKKLALLHSTHCLHSTLIWQSLILAVGNLRSKSPLSKPPIINEHAHINTRVHHIAKLKTANYIFMG